MWEQFFFAVVCWITVRLLFLFWMLYVVFHEIKITNSTKFLRFSFLKCYRLCHLIRIHEYLLVMDWTNWYHLVPFIIRCGQFFGLSSRGFFLSAVSEVFVFAGFYANAHWILKCSTLFDVWTSFNRQNEALALWECACKSTHWKWKSIYWESWNVGTSVAF